MKQTKTVALENGSVIHQTAGFESRSQAKEKIQRGKDGSGPARLAKFGDKPMRSRTGSLADAGGEPVEIRRIETVEKKMSDDQIVIAGRKRREARVRQAIRNAFVAAAGAGEIEHARARIDAVRRGLRNRCETSEEAAVAVA